MTPRKPKRTGTVLAHKKATVTLQRNGLAIEVQDVSAEDVGLAAKELLDTLRTLERMGYDELVHDAGGVHGGVVDQPEEYDGPDGTDPPHAKRRLGFTP